MYIRAISYLRSHAVCKVVVEVPSDGNVVQTVRIGLAGHHKKLCQEYWLHFCWGTYSSRTRLALGTDSCVWQ